LEGADGRSQPFLARYTQVRVCNAIATDAHRCIYCNRIRGLSNCHFLPYRFRNAAPHNGGNEANEPQRRSINMNIFEGAANAFLAIAAQTLAIGVLFAL
jgi:hypothetical protein